MTKIRQLASVLALIPLLLVAACASPPSSPEASLYTELGERQGIETIVEDLLYRIVDDPRLAPRFRGIDVAAFHRRLSDQICELSDGPCTYTGRAMTEVHADMNVTETQFNALAAHLVLAMEANDISTGAQNRLLARLVELHPQITHL